MMRVHVLAVTMVLFMTARVATTARASATTCWAPPEPDLTITVSCFTPSHLARLERRMPSLIDPSVAVRRTTRLPLTDAIPSPARYLGVDEFPDGRYPAYTHRLAVLRQPGGLVQVEGYVPTRDLSFRVSAAAPVAALRQIAGAIETAGSRTRPAAKDFPPLIVRWAGGPHSTGGLVSGNGPRRGMKRRVVSAAR